MPISDAYRSRMVDKLQFLYSDRATGIMQRIDRLADRYSELRNRRGGPLWNEKTVVLITYGDQIRDAGQAALEAQRRFLLDCKLDEVINTVHILPFFPYSSDDGFSVIDYRRVNPDVGDWPDLDRFGDAFGMAFDFVCNHCSQQHEWFRQYLKGEPPYTDYFIDVDPTTDLSAVTRPRSTPLLTAFDTDRGTKHVWTTFSADQVDLNFACPDMLLEALEILSFYLQHGATVIRLDAIGFLWKRIGTTCMHLPETHAVVKLMRDFVDDISPGTILLTETNVPHAENVSYFGDGDEAHAVYQFSLAPLLLDAFMTGDAAPLNTWLSSLDFPGERMTYFNFTASHDGIGVRPLEGLVSQKRLEGLVEGVRERGGLVGMRTNPDGTKSPYELNVSFVSALNDPAGLTAEEHAHRFLTSQAFSLALRGVPGIYFHSLVGTLNYSEGVEQTGHNRTINRRKFDRDELHRILSDESRLPRRILDGYRRMLAVRIAQPAFHPDAPQAVLEAGHASVIAFQRTSRDDAQQILVLTNFGETPVTLSLHKLVGHEVTQELLTQKVVTHPEFELAPYSIAWLT